MDRIDQILLIVGRIEGRLEAMQKLPERVSTLEMWQNWLKGAWAALVGGYLYLCRLAFWK
jgi:hypothetical protein